MFKVALGFVLALCVCFMTACSAPQSTNNENNTVEKPKEEGPQCFQGCLLNSGGECTTQGNVMDWSSSEAEEVQCDPRCCEKGAKGVDGATDPDQDGIFADADQCPDQAEDTDGFQDDDGCPEPDNDGDQILDPDDLCPLDAEDVDGFQDDDGCPDP